MSDLSDSRKKIEWAKQHIADLDAKKTAFFELNPYGVTPEYYIEQDFTVFYVDNFIIPPDSFGLIGGDVLHNLRSALDILACTLVRRTGLVPGNQVYFPICETAQQYKAQSPGKIKGRSSLDAKAISLFKPYGGGNDLLWGLHQADIADKHRLLSTPVIALRTVGVFVDTESVERAFGGLIRFKQPDAIAPHVMPLPVTKALLAVKSGDPITVVGGNHEKHKDVELTFDIAFGEPEVFKGRPILETLHQLADLVSAIVDSFSATD